MIKKDWEGFEPKILIYKPVIPNYLRTEWWDASDDILIPVRFNWINQAINTLANNTSMLITSNIESKTV